MPVDGPLGPLESRSSLSWAAPERLAGAAVSAIVPSLVRPGLGRAGDILGVVPDMVERGDHAGVVLLLALELGFRCELSAEGAGRRLMEYGKMDWRLPVLLRGALKCAVICWL